MFPSTNALIQPVSWGVEHGSLSADNMADLAEDWNLTSTPALPNQAGIGCMEAMEGWNLLVSIARLKSIFFRPLYHTVLVTRMRKYEKGSWEQNLQEYMCRMRGHDDWCLMVEHCWWFVWHGAQEREILKTILTETAEVLLRRHEIVHGEAVWRGRCCLLGVGDVRSRFAQKHKEDRSYGMPVLEHFEFGKDI